MPRKRRVTKLRARCLRWQDVTIREQLDFCVAWSPPLAGKPPMWLQVSKRFESDWQTWEEYLTDWSLVREDALLEWEARRAESLAQHKAEVATREAEVQATTEDFWRQHYQGLYENAIESLAEEEARELPFAESQYQRALQGLAPQTYAEMQFQAAEEAQDD